jgi:hypothetical protein
VLRALASRAGKFPAIPAMYATMVIPFATGVTSVLPDGAAFFKSMATPATGFPLNFKLPTSSFPRDAEYIITKSFWFTTDAVNNPSPTKFTYRVLVSDSSRTTYKKMSGVTCNPSVVIPFLVTRL